jgi:hypothetical protein
MLNAIDVCVFTKEGRHPDFNKKKLSRFMNDDNINKDEELIFEIDDKNHQKGGDNESFINDNNNLHFEEKYYKYLGKIFEFMLDSRNNN